MGLGQTMLSTAFLLLLAFAVINANRMMADRMESYYEMEATKQASYYANSLLDEISFKKFDSNLDPTMPQMVFEFSLPNYFYPGTEWGPSATAKNNVIPNDTDRYPYKSIRGDSPNYFDDIDDYDEYLREVNTGYLKGFYLKCIVRYTNDLYDVTDRFLDYQTDKKRAYVYVWNTRYLRDTLMFAGETIQYVSPF